MIERATDRPLSIHIKFLHIALGSLRELDTQLIIAKEVDLAEKNLFNYLLNEVEEMQSLLVATLNELTNYLA